MWRRLYVLPRLLPIHTCNVFFSKRMERGPLRGLYSGIAMHISYSVA